MSKNSHFQYMSDKQINEQFVRSHYGLVNGWFYDELQNVLRYTDGTTFPIGDYCNDPTLAIELMTNHGISVYREDGESFAFCGEEFNEIYGDISGYTYKCNDKNIIRAIIIVYLMMNV